MTTEARATEHAAYIREQSQRMIRAHAHRLVAGRRDVLAEMPAGQRCAELLTLTEKVAAGELHADELAAAALPHLTSVANASAEFEGLVDAVVERHRFVADPDEWLTRHDLSLSTAVYDAHDEATQSDVDFSVARLMGVR